ncbi:hypothetical protein [Streptosporangium subroseum]|nr:hypothetical protein OHB15_26800 [Streptosporangium subroseum]
MIFRGLVAGVLVLVVGALSPQRGFFPADRLLGVALRQLGGPAL